ncbi:hypothetical protein JG688_00004896 [Phytophthora aleatoria]|uniref:Uncharacterized protein n=1 Tax=Phytophthora aleatoria TaxID=2496075 RepID=A0A8J5MH38_9STRA|nr:hypothetical protein JG688_00004896 [Phytophthora aleatoria]
MPATTTSTVSETHYELIRDAIFDNDRARMTELLAVPGVDVDHFDAGGQTLLHLACFWGRMDLTKLLLAAGASLKTKNAAGYTALDLATHWGHSAVAEVIRLRGGSSVWEDKLGSLQVELEDLTLRAKHLETQNNDKRRRLETMTQEIQTVQTQLAEEKSAHALTVESYQRIRQQLSIQTDRSQQLEVERVRLTEELMELRVTQAKVERASARFQEEIAAMKAHRDEILTKMQESVKQQEQIAHSWQRAEVAAAISDSQRNFALAERDQFHRAQLATLAELLVTTERLGAAENELMKLKTDLAEHIFDMKREQRSQKHAARAMASTRPPGNRRPTTTPVDVKKARKPEEVDQLLQVARETPKKKFSLAAREYGDRVYLEEQQKLRGRGQRQQKVENQYRAHGFRAPVVDAEVFQEDFVSSVRAFASSRRMSESSSPPTLVAVNGNGLDTSFRDVILPLSRHELVLVIGKSVVLQNTQTQELIFVTTPEQPSGCLGEITAMALCGKRQHLSVCRAAVKADDGNPDSTSSAASIAVYSVTTRPDQTKGGNTRRIALLKTLAVTWTDRFVSTALSPDGKLVSSQAANSSWSLGVWDWGRGRQVALSDVHCRVSRVRFNVIDMAQLSTSGGNLLRIWTLCEYTLKPLASFKSGDETKVKNVVNYADHAWLPDDVLVGLLEDGDVQLIVNAELVQTLRSVHKGLGRMLCMSPLNNGEGVVVGGTHGLVSVIRLASKMLKANEKELHLQRRMRAPNTLNGGNTGEKMPFEITALESGAGLSSNRSDGNTYPNLLFTGTASGSVVIFSWKRKRGSLSGEGHSTILLTRAIKRVDLHTAPVVGLFYAARSRLLLSNAQNGVVLACKLCRENSGDKESSSAIATAIRDEQNLHDLSTNAFTSICQPEELAVYDRNKVELSRLKLLDLDGELQQFKMENEMLSRQVSEQRVKFESTLKSELAAHARTAKDEQKALRTELDVRLGGAIHERESRLRTLSEDARSAQDHYLMTLEKLQSECDSLREELHATKMDLQDEQKRAQEREVQLEFDGRKKLREAKVHYDTTQKKLTEELELAQRKLREVLKQQDQDQLVQMGLLASSIDSEKQKGATQLAEQNGKAAALNQQVKMLLGALTQKDNELQQMCCDYDERTHEIEILREKLTDEKALTKRFIREKEESVAQLAELRRVLENLQRLDGVHRSQLELLQKHILPKDLELVQMQEHLNQLHDANQEVVVQANISDRLRVEASSIARKQECELETTSKRLERVRHSIVVLQEELGELVRRSAVQEKSAIVTEIGRLHKRMTRQLDALQARGDSADDVNAELHRQNRFLLQNKHSLRRQVEAGNREKHKLAAALSFQNASLVTELNTYRKANKELERRLRRCEEFGAKGSGTAEVPETDEVDGRKLVQQTESEASPQISSTRRCQKT